MPLVRRLARPLLASMFITGGLDAARDPGPRAARAHTLLKPLVERVPQLSSSEQLVRLDGAMKVAAGAALALGKFPRVSALVLAGSLVPTTLAGHPFWEETDPAARKQQRTQFFKNASMLGGLLLAVVDTEGKPSLAWRARRVPGAVRHAAGDVLDTTGSAISSTADAVRDKLPI